MKQSVCWQASSQKISHHLWNSNFNYSVNKTPFLFHILSRMKPVHTFLSHFSKIRSNIILPSTPSSSEWSLPFKLFDSITLIIFGEEYKLWRTLYCVIFRNMFFLSWGVLSHPPNPISAGQHFAWYPRPLVQYICRYPSYVKAVSIRNLMSRHAVVTGIHLTWTLTAYIYVTIPMSENKINCQCILGKSATAVSTSPI